MDVERGNPHFIFEVPIETFLKAPPTMEMRRQSISAAHILLDSYRINPDGEFRRGFRTAVGKLLRSWEPTEETIEYGCDLIYLTGATRVEGGEEILRTLYEDKRCESLMTYDEPVSNFALRTLFDFPGQAEQEDFWEPLITNPLYYDSAYLAATLHSYAKGLQHLPAYLRMLATDERSDESLKTNLLELRLSMLVRHGQPSQEETRLRLEQLRTLEALPDQLLLNSALNQLMRS